MQNYLIQRFNHVRAQAMQETHVSLGILKEIAKVVEIAIKNKLFDLSVKFGEIAFDEVFPKVCSAKQRKLFKKRYEPRAKRFYVSDPKKSNFLKFNMKKRVQAETSLLLTPDMLKFILQSKYHEVVNVSAETIELDPVSKISVDFISVSFTFISWVAFFDGNLRFSKYKHRVSKEIELFVHVVSPELCLVEISAAGRSRKGGVYVISSLDDTELSLNVSNTRLWFCNEDFKTLKKNDCSMVAKMKRVDKTQFGYKIYPQIYKTKNSARANGYCTIVVEVNGIDRTMYVVKEQGKRFVNRLNVKVTFDEPVRRGEAIETGGKRKFHPDFVEPNDLEPDTKRAREIRKQEEKDDFEFPQIPIMSDMLTPTNEVIQFPFTSHIVRNNFDESKFTPGFPDTPLSITNDPSLEFTDEIFQGELGNSTPVFEESEYDNEFYEMFDVLEYGLSGPSEEEREYNKIVMDFESFEFEPEEQFNVHAYPNSYFFDDLD